jgi:prevent-host-death family protein
VARVTAFEAKTRFGKLLERVARGEEVVITKHEKPVARIVPEGRGNLEDVRAAVSGLRELRLKIAVRRGGKAKLTKTQIRSLIEEGRR